MSAKKDIKSLTTLIIISMFSALSLILYFFEFPVLSALPHLKLDFSDVPALLAGVIFGPIFGVLVELIKNLLELVIKGLGSQLGFGDIMNFIVGSAFIVPFSLVFRKLGEKFNYTLRILISSVSGLVSIIAFGIVGNYLISPPFFKYFMGIELTNDALWTAVWGATAINAIKGVMLSVTAFLLVKVIKNAVDKVVLTDK